MHEVIVMCIYALAIGYRSRDQGTTPRPADRCPDSKDCPSNLLQLKQYVEVNDMNSRNTRRAALALLATAGLSVLARAGDIAPPPLPGVRCLGIPATVVCEGGPCVGTSGNDVIVGSGS